MRITSVRPLHPAPDSSAPTAELTLEVAADESIEDAQCQAGLNDAKESLRTGGTSVRYTANIRKGGPHAGSTLLGQFIVAFGPLVSSALTGAAAAWLTGRNGRKVRLKIGEVEAEARTVAEVEKLLETASKFRNGDQGGDE